MKKLFFALIFVSAIPALAMEPVPTDENRELAPVDENTKYAPSAYEIAYLEQCRLEEETRIAHGQLRNQLHLAIHNEDYQQVELLLKQAANCPSKPDLSSALEPAIWKRNLKLCQLLIEHGVNPARNLHTAIIIGNLEIFKLFMSVIVFRAPFSWDSMALFGINPNHPSPTPPNTHVVFFETGRELLCTAAEHNQVEMCKMLLDAGNRDSYSLILAARNGNEELCKLLINANAYIETKDRYNDETPLLHAAINGHQNVCSLLINACADIDARNRYGHNALIRAKNSATRKLIVAHATNGNLDNKLVWAAQHYTEHQLNHEICKLIYNDQTEVNARIKATLVCLNRMRKKGNQAAGDLFRWFKTLMLPHLGNYIPLKRLVNARDADGNQAYDYLKLDFLKPKESGFLEKCTLQ